MSESILFLTGHLARARLEAVLQGMKASFPWKVLDIGVKVAALMTEEIIMRRLPKPVEADKIMLPGRCRADLDRLSDSGPERASVASLCTTSSTAGQSRPASRQWFNADQRLQNNRSA